MVFDFDVGHGALVWVAISVSVAQRPARRPATGISFRAGAASGVRAAGRVRGRSTLLWAKGGSASVAAYRRRTPLKEASTRTGEARHAAASAGQPVGAGRPVVQRGRAIGTIARASFRYG